jgi:hypothetical protein
VLRIPIAPLAGHEPPARWRANFFRVDRGGFKNPDEFSAWSPAMASPPDFHDARRFGSLILDS